jgi:hypothetical protein
MFDQRRKLSTRLADAVDLAIDLATLGEYGLEPVEPARCGRRGRPARAAGSGERFAAGPARATARA